MEKRGKRVRVDANNPAAGAMRTGRLNVLNKTAAAVQVTAGQLLAEAFDLAKGYRESEAPDLVITSKVELIAHRAAKRTEFNTAITRDVHKLSNWIKFAQWEAHQPCIPEARAVFERATDFHSNRTELWKTYINFEMKYGGADRTRGVLSRAVTALPAEEELWLYFAWVEEMIGSPATVRAVFEKWMTFQPPQPAWRAYVRFELFGVPQGAVTEDERKERVRAILARFAAKHNVEATWLFYAECEGVLGDMPRAVEVLRTALLALPNSDYERPKLSIALAFNLERLDLIDDARIVFQKALAACEGKPLQPAHEELSESFTRFELVNGNDEQLTAQVFNVRRAFYRAKLREQPGHLTTWFNLIGIEKASHVDKALILDLYNAASFGAVPTAADKNSWRPQAIMWQSHALFLENDMNDAEQATTVYKRALACTQDKPFTFSKIWIGLAELYIRCFDIEGALSILAAARKHMATRKLFKRSLEILEMAKRYDEVRAIYAEYVDRYGAESGPWLAFATFEFAQGRPDAAYAVYDRALSHPALTDRDAIWLANVGSRLSRNDIDGARAAYVKLFDVTLAACLATVKSLDDPVETTEAVNQLRKVLQLLVRFELSLGGDQAAALTSLRAKWKDACSQVRKCNVKVVKPLFADWLEFELRFGDSASQQEVKRLENLQSTRLAKLADLGRSV